MITVAVTGCSGYLGSKIIQNLEAADDVITPATKCCVSFRT